mgnify:CR=1 FL=1
MGMELLIQTIQIYLARESELTRIAHSGARPAPQRARSGRVRGLPRYALVERGHEVGEVRRREQLLAHRRRQQQRAQLFALAHRGGRQQGRHAGARRLSAAGPARQRLVGAGGPEGAGQYGAGRPREIQGESPIVNLGIRISEEQAQALDEIAEELLGRTVSLCFRSASLLL